MDDPGFEEQREDLLESIGQDEERVRVALHELTDAAGFKLDVRKYIKTSPLTWAIGAFLVGAWLGGRGQRRP